MKQSGIYKITINKKMYVGYAKDCKRRERQHYGKLTGKKHINQYLQNAFIKYDEFNFEIIEECIEELLQEREIYWIAELDTFKGDGYNLTAGGAGRTGATHTEESKRKMSESKKGENNPNFGKPLSAETKRKLSAANSGKNNPMRNEEVKAKVVGKRVGEHYRRHLTKEIIMPFVEKGWDRNKIARHFGCSPHTIKARILDKPIRQVWEENNGKTKWQEKAIAEGRTRYRKRFDGKGGSWVHPVPEKWKQKAASCKKTCAERRRVR